jgi:predicted Zn-dependent protease
MTAMAHVIERHATSRVGAATPLAILFGVPSGIPGTVSPTLGGIVGGAGRVVGLALAPYSRDQEREADRVGIALSARAGWNPDALAGFLQTLERAEALAGSESKRSQFFATHPSTPERVANVEVMARSLSPTRDDPVSAARAEGLSEAQLQRVQRLEIARLPAATLTAVTRDGDRVAFTWIAHRTRVFRVTGVTGDRDWERYADVFARTAATFRPLRSEERQRIVEAACASGRLVPAKPWRRSLREAAPRGPPRRPPSSTASRRMRSSNEAGR